MVHHHNLHLLLEAFLTQHLIRGGLVAGVMWPPRSPDLTPLDFFLWSELKNFVYDTSIDSEEGLIARNARNSNTPNIFNKI